MRIALLLSLLLSFGLAGCSMPGSWPQTTRIEGSAAGASIASPLIPSSPAITLPPHSRPTSLQEAQAGAAGTSTLGSTAPPSAATEAPGPTAAPTRPACLDRGGRIESGTLRTDLLRLPLEFRVYLPPCYAQETGRRYPVLYLIHGQNYNDDQWDRLGVDETADRLIASGKAPPFIVVMPRDRAWTQPNENNFGRAVAENLIPWIDSHYRTQATRQGRAVGGLSRGAGWAIHLGLSRWELFGSIGAHSLPVFWTDLPHLRQWMNAIPPDALPRIYLDLGDKDRPQISKSARWFEQLLTDRGIPHEWHLYPGYHEEAYWEAHVEEYLRWYSRQW